MKWSIGTKIGSGYVVALAVLVLLGVISYVTSAGLIESAGLVTHSYKVLGELDGVVQAMTDAETGQRGYLITGKESYLQPFNLGTKTVASYVKDLRQLTTGDPDQQKSLDALELLISSKVGELRQTIALRRTDGLNAALPTVLSGDGKSVMDKIREVISRMKTAEDGLLQRRDIESRKSQATLVSIIIYGIPTSILILVILSIFITQNISKPLKMVSKIADRLANGDLSQSVPNENRRDEVGSLLRSFGNIHRYLQSLSTSANQISQGDLTVRVNLQSEDDVLGKAFSTMSANLRQIIQQTQQGIGSIGTSASEILAATTQVASGALETSSGVNETTSTIEEVRQTVQLSSQKAKSVAEVAQKSLHHSQAGRKAVEEMVVSMNRIREQMELIGESIVRMSEQSQAIGEITATVSNLAEQSNLLAVNASIEAAKAGDLGRGFAVVAQEVKSLAEQSKQATAQVRSILGDVQKATTGAVMAAEQGSKVVEAAVQQSGQATEAIQVLAESIAEASQAATQIVASSREQVVGMDQVTIAIENIKVASMQNVASTRQAETAAKQLNELGQELQELIEQYRI